MNNYFDHTLPQNNLEYRPYKHAKDIPTTISGKMDNLALLADFAFDRDSPIYKKREIKNFLNKVLDKGENLQSLAYRYSYTGHDLTKPTRLNVNYFIQSSAMLEEDFLLYKKIINKAIGLGVHPLEYSQGHESTILKQYLISNGYLQYQTNQMKRQILEFLAALHPDSVAALEVDTQNCPTSDTALSITLKSYANKFTKRSSELDEYLLHTTECLLSHMKIEQVQKNWTTFQNMHYANKANYDYFYILLSPLFEKRLLNSNIQGSDIPPPQKVLKI